MLGRELAAQDFMKLVGETLLKVPVEQMEKLADLIYDCYRQGQAVFICGNGGSGANASHFCEDLGKGTIRREDLDNDSCKRLRVLSLTDNTPYITAWANDEGYDRIFVEQLKNWANCGDLLIAISGSGNSSNVLRAVEWANQHGLITFGCTGFDGGKLKTLARHNLHVPVHDMGIVESIHLTIFHWVLDNLYVRIHGSSSPSACQQRRFAPILSSRPS
ncbi:MAG: SIS domain-containing protein [Gemmatales bacterium]|nr:SIS domain-containing protein [Gemmatales bacterium]MCS7159984.1 SIS domain-containing protein [Gemmatales bacterium]MDW8175183.1 SIS domain-containing protein [Gemmatales bacterium]MDW8223430.1 SIS domain-containing protein [Gemmatales bacterium]